MGWDRIGRHGGACRSRVGLGKEASGLSGVERSVGVPLVMERKRL